MTIATKVVGSLRTTEQHQMLFNRYTMIISSRVFTINFILWLLGLGVLGWHSYLQRNMIPFEGMEAKQLTTKIFKDIHEKSEKATKELARIYGEPEVLEGYGRRNTTLLAIAPTTSSSAILGQASPGIEPLYSNYYKAGLAKGNFMRKNKNK